MNIDRELMESNIQVHKFTLFFAHLQSHSRSSSSPSGMIVIHSSSSSQKEMNVDCELMDSNIQVYDWNQP